MIVLLTIWCLVLTLVCIGLFGYANLTHKRIEALEKGVGKADGEVRH